MRRLYLNKPLKQGAYLSLTDDRFNYLARVLRARVNEEIILFNGLGGEYSATITEINRRDLQLTVGEYNPIDRTSSLSIHLYQAMAKGDRLEFVFQKATELGVTHITPLITERAVMNLNPQQLPKRMERWQAIIESACEQSGLNRIPQLNAPLPFEQLLETPFSCPHLTLAPTAELTLSQVITQHLSDSREIAIIIGPEGGLSDEEINALTAHSAYSAQLGERILRTETAALSVISTLHALIGDWR